MRARSWPCFTRKWISTNEAMHRDLVDADRNLTKVSPAGCKLSVSLGRLAHIERPIDDRRQPMRYDGSGSSRQVGDRAGVVALDAQLLFHDREHVDGGRGPARKPITNTVPAIAVALTERAKVSVPPVS
jgi:hypothetical protein